jgi:single-stranded DNA-binding protein
MSLMTNGDAKNHRHNFVNLSLQVGKDGEGKYSGRGLPLASCRAFYSQGKDKSTDEFLPSIWFKLVAFGKEGEDIDSNPTVLLLSKTVKGDKVEVMGRLGLEEWTNADGEKRSTFVLYASDLKVVGNGGVTEPEPQP